MSLTALLAVYCGLVYVGSLAATIPLSYGSPNAARWSDVCFGMALAVMLPLVWTLSDLFYKPARKPEDGQ